MGNICAQKENKPVCKILSKDDADPCFEEYFPKLQAALDDFEEITKIADY
jgi:hypothetical protein